METHENRMSPKFWVGLLVTVFCGSVIMFALSSEGLQSMRNEGNQLQNQLISKYNRYGVDLRVCMEQSQAVAGTDMTTKNILTGVISQFDPEPDAIVTKSMIVKQIDESFWRLDGTRLDRPRLNELGDVALDCRDEFLSSQRDNQAQAQALDDWTNGILPWLLRSDLPNDQLAVVGPDGKKLHGDEALWFIMNPQPLVR